MKNTLHSFTAMSLASFLGDEISKKRVEHGENLNSKGKRLKVDNDINKNNSPEIINTNIDNDASEATSKSVPIEEIEYKVKETESEIGNFDEAADSKETARYELLLRKKDLQEEKESNVGTVIELNEINGNKETLATKDRGYIKLVLLKWQESGSALAEVVLETKKHLVPLLFQLRKQVLPEEMLISLSTIFYYAQQKKYTAANEAYLKLSVGNVAWPIGLVGVGIHERSASHKISGDQKVANIMVNEQTRKWITAIKRLITFLETCGASG